MTGLVPFNRRKNDLLDTRFTDFGNMLDDFFTVGWPFPRSLAADTFKIDVQEKEKEYLIEAELPGFNKDEVKVEVEEGHLKIAVNKEETVEEKDKNYIHRERKCTSMQRNIHLGEAAAEGIKAKLDNGVLTIVVPKKEKVDITVKVDVE